MNELQFMNVIWSADAPLTATNILERSVNKKWKDASLHTILNKLLSKGAIAEHGFVKDGKAIARTFIPLISCEKYCDEFFSVFPNKEMPKIISVLLSRLDFDDETKARIEKIIQDNL